MDTNFPGLIPDGALSNGLIPIEYVGNKKEAFDNVARSGKVWSGKGDVQEVSPPQAKILLLYPDQWARAGGVVSTILTPPLPVPGAEESGGPATVPVEAVEGKRLEKMTKPELRAYALARFGKTLPNAMAPAGMRNEIEEFENTLEPLPGSVKAAR